MIRSGHVDTFARDNLPPREQWPEFKFTLPELQYPERLNCVPAFVDKWVAAGDGERIAIVSPYETWTYAQLAERINRIANVLTRDLGLVPGNRVLLRAPNSPMAIACHLAIIKAGGVTVATMPLLRAKELSYAVTKARIKLALCDTRLFDEMEKTRPLARELERIVYWGDGQLEDLMARPGYGNFTACDTASDDVCLIAFTSGTTGQPKGTMHFQRDMLASADSYSKYVLQPNRDDRFIGSPPLAFTFGLGGHVLFPFRIGATSIQLESAPPDVLLPAIAKYKATICFTAPTAYRAMLGKLAEHDISSLRKCVSAGEALPKATFEAWQEGDGPEDPRRHRRDRDDAYLHRLAGKRNSPGRDRQGRAGLRGQGDRREWPRLPARHDRPPRRARPDRLPLSRGREADEVRAARLERHRRHLRAWMPMATSGTRRAPTT